MGECLVIRTGGGLDTSSATASAECILVGYTAYANDSKLSGTMVNNGQQSVNIGPGGSSTISEGYHDGTGLISVSSLSSNTSGNATISQILNGYTGWVNGSKLTGSMTNQGTKTWTLTPNTSGSSSQTIGAGYHNGSGKVSQSITTVAGSTTTPGTANKTLAAASRWVSGNLIVAGNSNLVSGNIKKGVSIFGVTGTWTGYVSGDFYYIQNGVMASNCCSGSGMSTTWVSVGAPTKVGDALRFYVSIAPYSDDGTAYSTFTITQMPSVSGKACRMYVEVSSSYTTLTETRGYISPVFGLRNSSGTKTLKTVSNITFHNQSDNSTTSESIGNNSSKNVWFQLHSSTASLWSLPKLKFYHTYKNNPGNYSDWYDVKNLFIRYV